MSNKHKLIFVTLSLVTLLLRTYRLGDRPLGFTWDEAALGYNAYSLLQTGRDEHGQILPIIFKSFGDYKPGLYVYLATVPTLFGLNEFTTRLPSAISGVLLLFTVYCLCRYLFSSRIALAAAFILAINPWAIHFSRGAWEANIALTLSVLAVLLFVRRYYHTSLFFFGLTLLTYHGAKLFTPLLIISLLIVYRPKTKDLITPFLLLLFTVTPILFGISTQSGRFEVYSVFSYTRNIVTISEIQRQDSSQPLFYFLYHSELLDQLRGILQRYLNHLSPKFIFFTGDWSNVRHSLVHHGYFYLPELITLITGIYVLIKKSHRHAHLIWLWLFLAPLPAALSRDIVSGVRALPLVIPLAILSGLGLAHKKLWCLIPIFCIFVISYLDLYYIHYPLFSTADWLAAYKPAITQATTLSAKYDQVFFTDSLGQPYIFYLFYNKISPHIFQTSHSFVAGPNGDVGSVPSFDKFSFGPIDWSALQNRSSLLIVTTSPDSPALRVLELP